MKNSVSIRLISLLSVPILLFLMPKPCFAFQEHGPMEGLYIHLLAHICFFSSMLWLFFMIKKSTYWAKKWWKDIALGGLLLAFWNIMTFVGHILGPKEFYFCNNTLAVKRDITFWIWYFTKFDTIVCCLSMVFFLWGLKRLNRAIVQHGSKADA